MEQYISKSALVAEIERRMKLRQDSYRKYNDVNDFVAFEELEYLHDEFLPTLEVKEVDLEKELKHLIGNVGQCDRKLAKHFFELGLKAQKGE